MSKADLLRRIAIMKRNPQYAALLPHQDFVELASDIVAAHQMLQKAMSDGRLQGEKGEAGKDGYSPIREVNEALRGFEQRFSAVSAAIESKVAAIQNGKDGRDGQDAEVTDDLKAEIAEMARALIELPDFPTLITQEPEAIRDSLELLQGDARLSIDAIRGLEERLDDLVRYMGAASGGTIGKQQVYNWIRAAVSDGTIPAGGGGGGFTIETPTGTVDGTNVTYTVTAIPKYIVYYGTTLFEGANGYSRSSLTITMPYPPTIADQFKAFI